MSLFAALIVLMQANTAIPDPSQRLEPGRWILRTTIERATGLGGVSASLQSNDRQYRLVVRCDFAYASNISIQFMRDVGNIPATALPAIVLTEPGKVELDLEWEETPAGVFARDSDFAPTATAAAAFLQGYHGELHVNAHDKEGRAIRADFDALAGHAAIGQILDRCSAANG
jgi:hypothetical protein